MLWVTAAVHGSMERRCFDDCDAYLLDHRLESWRQVWVCGKWSHHRPGWLQEPESSHTPLVPAYDRGKMDICLRMEAWFWATWFWVTRKDFVRDVPPHSTVPALNLPGLCAKSQPVPSVQGQHGSHPEQLIFISERTQTRSHHLVLWWVKARTNVFSSSFVPSQLHFICLSISMPSPAICTLHALMNLLTCFSQVSTCLFAASQMLTSTEWSFQLDVHVWQAYVQQAMHALVNEAGSLQLTDRLIMIIPVGGRVLGKLPTAIRCDTEG